MGAEIALIFGSVDYGNWECLSRYRGNVHVFCADGGIHLARKAGFRPEVYVGDGDSGGKAGNGIASVTLPVEKDVTDLQAAFTYACNQGFREVIFTACTGGRQDHHLANLQLLQLAARKGVRARIVDPDNEIRYVENETVKFSCAGFQYFSLLPMDEILSGVTIENAKYPLAHVTVRRGDSLTVSNEPKDGPVTITVEKGAAWLVLSQRLDRKK